MNMRRRRTGGRLALTVSALAVAQLALASGSAVADGAPACAYAPGPVEYQSVLGPLMSDSPLPPPPPPPPPARASRASGSASGGAGGAAREAVGDQFTLLWVNNALQGWVVGVAPGPLSIEQARAAIIDRLTARFAGADLAYLVDHLHVDPQPYRESELRATQDAISADLQAAGVGGWSSGFGLCRLSDAIRVEVTVYQPAPEELVQRVQTLLVPHGDRVRLQISPYGAPQPAIAMAPRVKPVPAAAVSVLRYVSIADARRCIAGSRSNIAVRRSGRGEVATLSVRANGRQRTITGARLGHPLAVELTSRRTRVEVSVRLRDGRRGTRTVTLTRCR